MTTKVFAIIVTYNPDPAALSVLCAQLCLSAKVIVVDNSPPKSAPQSIFGVDWHTMGWNAGIAAAQNVGIRSALTQGAEVIAFFDQDSEPGEQLIPLLVAELGVPPRGVAAPVCLDIRTGAEYSPFRFNRWGLAVPAPASGLTTPVEVDFIISSGSVVAAGVFEQAGLMEEGFFIDFVDLEWCIRCRRANVQILVVPSVTMHHAIGNEVVKCGPFTTFVHTPVRGYYRLRNALLLIRLAHVPRLYVLHEVMSALLHHLIQWPYSQDRYLHAHYGWRGLVDGLRGVRGKIKKTSKN